MRRRPRASASSTRTSSRRSFAQLQQFKQYYAVREPPRRRPLRDQRQDPGHRDRRARAQPERLGRRTDLVQQHHRLHPRIRRRRRLRQQAVDDWRAGVPRVRIPSTGELGKYQPRIYFGENSPQYSIVGGPRVPRRSNSTTRRATTAPRTRRRRSGQRRSGAEQPVHAA